MMSGPRWPTQWASSRVGRTSTSCTRTPTACADEVASHTRIWWPGAPGPPGGPVRQDPSIRRWWCSVHSRRSSASRVSMCLPTTCVPSTCIPRRSTVANRGTRRSARTSVPPARAASSRRAVRRTASPSGMPPSSPIGGGIPSGADGSAQVGRHPVGPEAHDVGGRRRARRPRRPPDRQRPPGGQELAQDDREVVLPGCRSSGTIPFSSSMHSTTTIRGPSGAEHLAVAPDPNRVRNVGAVLGEVQDRDGVRIRTEAQDPAAGGHEPVQRRAGTVVVVPREVVAAARPPAARGRRTGPPGGR